MIVKFLTMGKNASNLNDRVDHMENDRVVHGKRSYSAM